MNKLCSPLFTLTVLLTFASSAQPQTPAPVPDQKAVLADAQKVLNESLSLAIERHKKAKAATVTTTQGKNDADALVKRMENDLKTVTKKRDDLKKAVDGEFAVELQKLTAAFQAWAQAQSDLATATSAATRLSDLALNTVKANVTATKAALDGARKKFKAFADASGVLVGNEPDPMDARNAFTQTLAGLNRTVADLTPKVEEARRKAGTIGTTLSTAQAEEKAAADALRELAVPALTLAKLDEIGTRPVEVKLQPAVEAKLGELVSAVQGNTSAVNTLATNVGTVSTKVGEVTIAVNGLTGEVKGLRTDLNGKLDALCTVVGTLQKPDLSALATELKTALAGGKLTDVQITEAMGNVKRLTDAIEAISKTPGSPDAVAQALGRIEALMTAWKDSQATPQVLEEVGTDQCGRSWTYYYFVDKNGKKRYVTP